MSPTYRSTLDRLSPNTSIDTPEKIPDRGWIQWIACRTGVLCSRFFRWAKASTNWARCARHTHASLPRNCLCSPRMGPVVHDIYQNCQLFIHFNKTVMLKPVTRECIIVFVVSIPIVTERKSNPRGVLLGILVGGVPPGCLILDPISDQKMPFSTPLKSTPVFRPGL